MHLGVQRMFSLCILVSLHTSSYLSHSAVLLVVIRLVRLAQLHDGVSQKQIH